MNKVMMKEYCTTAEITAKMNFKLLCLFLSAFLFCSCSSNESSGDFVSIFVFQTDDCYTNYYIEINKGRTINCTKGLETECIRRDIYDDKKIMPGVENFISNDTSRHEIIDYETRSWTYYDGPKHKSDVIDESHWEMLESYLAELSDNTSENIFSKTLGTKEWKWNNAGVVVMYKGDVYTFWHDSEHETEKKIYRCIEEICPFRIAIAKKENKPSTIVIPIKN